MAVDMPDPVPVLELQAQAVPPTIKVRRGTGVPDDFWLALIAEWGAFGPATGAEIAVPVERFLSRRRWLGDTCQRYGVGVIPDETTTELLTKARAEQEQLQTVLHSGSETLSTGEARARLEGSRLRRELRSFQERDFAKLLGLDHGANFSVPGAGKTTVAYAVYEAERLAGRVAQMLVIAPLSAFEAWQREAQACFDPVPTVAGVGGRASRKIEVLLVGYQRLLYSYDEVAAWASARPTLVVLDEAHRMKRGWAGQWGRACLHLAFRAARRDVLTGTPAPQQPADLQALLDFLWPGQARRILPPAALAKDPLPGATRQAAEAIRPLFARTTKGELGLRPIDYQVVRFPLAGLQAEIYQGLVSRYAGRFRATRGEQVTFARMGQVVMYLLEAATNPALLTAGSSRYDPIVFHHPPLEVEPGSTLAELLAAYPAYETPPKFIELARLVRANAHQGRKTLVWSNFVRNLITLAARELAPYQPAVIHGGVPSALDSRDAAVTRESELERFRHDPGCTVLLANPAATSEGVSLHDVCHDAVYLDRTFNAGQYLQSLDRIHRLGLPADQATRVTFLTTADTVDTVVDERIAVKAERLGALLNDPDFTTMALPDEDDYGDAVDSYEDVAALFAHLHVEGGDGG